MTARFRCPQCRQALRSKISDDPEKGFVLKCPQCGGRLVVPPALARLPSPQVDGSEAVFADEGPIGQRRRAAVVPMLTRCMPWMMSVFLHMALALIFMLVAMITVPELHDLISFAPQCNVPMESAPIYTRSVPIPNYAPRSAGGRPRAGENGGLKPAARPQDISDSEVIGPSSVLTGLESQGDPAKLLGGLGGGAMFGLGGGGWGIGGGRLPDVVYLIDRSGSMVDAFDVVRRQMLLSVGRMEPYRKFHVVLFSDGQPLEKSPRRMTPAGPRAKLGLVEFLGPVRAQGKTDPIPAINRAFDVLAGGSSGRPVIVYLLTDGVFPDNQAVLEAIRRRNARGLVRINTILYGNRPPIAEKVLARIAADSGGEYRFISRDE